MADVWEETDLVDWLFRPGDLIFQWPDEHGRGWYGYVIVEGCKRAGWGRGFPIYDLMTAKFEVWHGSVGHWHGVGMKQGLGREIIEQRCTYVCEAWNSFYHEGETPRPILQPQEGIDGNR